MSPGEATCKNVFKVFPVILDLQVFWKARYSRHTSEYASGLWCTGSIFGWLSLAKKIKKEDQWVPENLEIVVFPRSEPFTKF